MKKSKITKSKPIESEYKGNNIIFKSDNKETNSPFKNDLMVFWGDENDK